MSKKSKVESTNYIIETNCDCGETDGIQNMVGCECVTVYLFRIINVSTGTNGIIIKVLWIKYYVIFIPCL